MFKNDLISGQKKTTFISFENVLAKIINNFVLYFYCSQNDVPFMYQFRCHYMLVCVKTEEPKEKRENIESNIYGILTAFLWKNWPVIDERTYRLRYMHYSLNHPGLLLVYKRYGMLLPKRATTLVSETRYGHIHWPYIGTLIRFYHIHSCLFGIFHTHQYMKAGTKKREMEQF